MMRIAIAGFGLFVLVLLIGCQSTVGSAPPTRGTGADVDELRVLTAPTAMNYDESATPNGLAVQVYALRRPTPKAVAVVHGRLELMLFDGQVARSQLATTEPKLMWRYSAAQLATFASQAAAGVGYGFVLRWDGEEFTTGSVTVAVRYQPDEPGAAAVYSSPVTLMLR